MTDPEITDRRSVKVENLEWTINEFDYGQRYMLVATGNAVQFAAHFDRGGWRALQGLLAANYAEEEVA